MTKVDKGKCTGCGTCVGICPEVFELGDDGKAFVKEDKDLPCVKQAKESCPVDAIQ